MWKSGAFFGIASCSLVTFLSTQRAQMKIDNSPISAVYNVCNVDAHRCDDEELTELEKSLDVVLSPAYRSYLQEFNGGHFTNCRVDMSDVDSNEGTAPAPTSVWLQRMDSTRTPKEKVRSLWANHELRVVRDGDNAYLLIGATISGDYLYVALHGELTDHIILRTSNDWYVVAASIQDFFRLVDGEESSE